MRTKDRDAGLETRKAFVWQEETPPSLADLRAGGERRKAFLRYWWHDTLNDAPKWLSYHGLKLLPSAWASALGAFHYGIVCRFYPGRSRRMQENAARIRPDLDPAAVMRANWRNKGRLMAEFSVCHASPAAEMSPSPCRAPACRPQPGTHHHSRHASRQLGAPASGAANARRAFATFYMPPESRFEHSTACRIRRNFGAELLAPGVRGVRPALKHLARKDGVVMIFGDEGFDNRIMAPFFGRLPHLAGNLAIAVRLARHSGASIVPVHVLRRDGARFECRWLPSLDLTPEDEAGASLATDVARLNAVIEPVVSAHIDQWFFLDHHL